MQHNGFSAIVCGRPSKQEMPRSRRCARAKAWEIGHQVRNQNQIVVEFVRAGEKVANWTELLTMQVIEIARAVYGKFDVFRLAYAAKTSALPPDTLESLIEEITAAKIVRH